MSNIIDCACDVTTGCGEPAEAGCPACQVRDPYSPCPAFGFMCELPTAEPCSCCTPEQRELTRRYYQRPLHPAE